MSEKKTIEDLRAILFDTIAAVKAGTLDTERAKCISELSQVMVNSAKVEVQFLQATNGGDSAFLSSTTPAAAPALPAGILGVHVHRMK